MKGSLITSFLVLCLLYAATAEDCIRKETSEISVNVGWCSEAVTATLDNPIGYCSNAKCRSTHKMHTSPEVIVRGKHFIVSHLVHFIHVVVDIQQVVEHRLVSPLRLQ